MSKSKPAEKEEWTGSEEQVDRGKNNTPDYAILIDYAAKELRGVLSHEVEQIELRMKRLIREELVPALRELLDELPQRGTATMSASHKPHSSILGRGSDETREGGRERTSVTHPALREMLDRYPWTMNRPWVKGAECIVDYMTVVEQAALELKHCAERIDWR